MDIVTNIAIIGGAGVATFVAAPVVGGAALGLLGFKAGGIAAGSVAASMMSSSAVASGGGVLTGSLVATLQSVGAAGLGSGASAVAGGVASVATAAYQYMSEAGADN